MAYLKGIATKLTGSIGQFTFKQRGGLTVVSERVTNIANPRTAAQQNQRTKWGNVVRLYSGISPLLNCAFENKPARTSDFNMFMKYNLPSAEVRLTKAEVAAKACVAAPCIVSVGTLTTIELTGEAGASVTDIVLGSFTISDTTTVGDFAKAVVNNNDNFNFGDQIAFIVVRQGVNSITGYPQCAFSGERVTLEKSSVVKLREVVSAEGFSVKDGHLACALADSFQGAYAWIVSRKESNTVRVSSQVMVVKNDLYAEYTDANAYTRAAKSYGGQTDNFLTPEVTLMSGSGAVDAPDVSGGGSTNGGSSGGGSGSDGGSGSAGGSGSDGGSGSTGGSGNDGGGGTGGDEDMGM